MSTKSEGNVLLITSGVIGLQFICWIKELIIVGYFAFVSGKFCTYFVVPDGLSNEAVS